MSSTTKVLIGVSAGLVVGVALAFIAHYFDPFVRGRDELEAMGWIVIAEIPKGRG